MNTSHLESLILHIKKAADLVYSRESKWGVEQVVLKPPATAEAIDTLSAKCPYPLPPSYRSFLGLHDGSLNFWFRFTLVGTSGEPHDIVTREIEDARETQSEYAANAAGKVTAESIAAFETPKDGSAELFIPSHTVLGTNEGGEFLLFNEAVRKGDEYEVVHHTYSGGIHQRYDNFEAYLEATLKKAEDYVKKKKYL